MKTKIVILGSTGLLGNAVGKYFLSKNVYETYPSYLCKDYSYGDNSFYFDALVDSNLNYIPECDFVINCIGIIKPYIKNCIKNSIKVNSLFPHNLSSYCETRGYKLIHISTDCVYSGLSGDYNENSPHDCLDEYGKTKSLGEPKNCMILRTSIIGEEIHGFSSLVSWAKQMSGQKINGYTNHIWNGITTKQYADICDQIIRLGYYYNGTYHVFSDKHSKYEMLEKFNSKWNLGLDITPVETNPKCNRSLSTEKFLNSNLSIPTLEDMLRDI